MNTATLSTDIAETPRVHLSAPPLEQPARPNHANRFELNGETDLPAPRQSRRPSLKRAALVALIAFAGIGAAKFADDWWTTGRFIESTDDAYVGGDVTVIAPKVAGFISQLAVTDNQQVHAGDLLLKLDDRDYRAALAKAEAAVAIQKAALANLDATRNLQDAVVAQAQAGIAAADAEITRTHDDQARAQNLLGTRCRVHAGISKGGCRLQGSPRRRRKIARDSGGGAAAAGQSSPRKNSRRRRRSTRPLPIATSRN